MGMPLTLAVFYSILIAFNSPKVKVEEKFVRVPKVRDLNLEFLAHSNNYSVVAFVDRTKATICFLYSEKDSIYLWNYGLLGYKRVHIADFSADGSEVIYMYSFQKFGDWEKKLAIYNISQNKTETLLSFEGARGIIASPPRFSPDGKWIALFGELAPDEGYYFWLISRDGRIKKKIGKWEKWQGLVWSNTGRYIAYNRIEGERAPFRPYLWIYDVEKDTHWLLAEGGDLWKSFSPDDRWIVFNSREGNIWLGKVDGSEFRTLARLLGSDYEWSPDGQKIAFYWAKVDPIRDKETEAYLNVVNIDGTGLRRLAELPPGLMPARLGFRWKDNSTIVIYRLEKERNQ